MIVYVITSGTYSDYHIDAVCDSYESARRKCLMLTSKASYDDYYITPWDTETTRPCQADAGNYYHVWQDDDGQLKCEPTAQRRYSITISSQPMEEWMNFCYHIDGLKARDEAHALKYRNRRAAGLCVVCGADADGRQGFASNAASPGPHGQAGLL